MSIEKKCVECSVIIVDEWFLVCNGFMCNKVISYNCAANFSKKLLSKFPQDVKKAMKILIDSISGLRWFCPGCLDGTNDHHRKLVTSLKKIEKAEMTLTTAIKALSTTPKSTEERRVTRLQSKSTNQDKPSFDSDIITQITQARPTKYLEQPNTTKFPEVIDAIPTVAVTVPSSQSEILTTMTSTITPITQVQPTKPLEQQKTTKIPEVVDVISTVAVTVPSSQSEISASMTSTITQARPTKPLEQPKTTKIPEVIDVIPTVAETVPSSQSEIMPEFSEIKVVAPRRWLFVSRIAQTVTKVQFENFIKTRLKLDKAICMELPPNREDGRIYDYTSFRISLPADQFVKALQSTIWPEGLLVKEFQWRTRRQNFRKASLVQIQI